MTFFFLIQRAGATVGLAKRARCTSRLTEKKKKRIEREKEEREGTDKKNHKKEEYVFPILFRKYYS